MSIVFPHENIDAFGNEVQVVTLQDFKNINARISIKTKEEFHRLLNLYIWINKMLTFDDDEIVNMLFSTKPDVYFGRKLTEDEKAFISTIKRPGQMGEISLEDARKDDRISGLLAEHAIRSIAAHGIWPTEIEPFHREEMATKSLAAYQEAVSSYKDLIVILDREGHVNLKELCEDELNVCELHIRQLEKNQELLKQFPRNKQLQIQRLQIQLAKGDKPMMDEQIPPGALLA